MTRIDDQAILIKIINMKNLDWMDRASACSRLGIRPQTLYAYVSRGLIRAQADPVDRRRSLYSAGDVDALAAQHKRPRARAKVAEGAMRWGDPVLKTKISHVADGCLWFGAKRADTCATEMTLEQVAAHHCDVPRFDTNPRSPRVGQGGLSAALAYLAQEASTVAQTSDSNRMALADEGARLLSGICDQWLAKEHKGAIHERLATHWDVRDPDLIRRALVLLSDHELNPSSFAVRVCASTGASLAASLLSGLATLTGPRHGGVYELASGVLDAARAGTKTLDRYLIKHAIDDPYTCGYGHPLYPKGDPRAVHILSNIAKSTAYSADFEALNHVADHFGAPPNIDAALAMMTHLLNLPKDAGFVLFALGRMAGWIAHAIEQRENPFLIRPRADYIGALPVSVQKRS